MSVIRYEELDQLAGELLPERTVLGVVSTPFNGFGPGYRGTAILSACQAPLQQFQAASIFYTILGAQSTQGGVTCVPAAIASY